MRDTKLALAAIFGIWATALPVTPAFAENETLPPPAQSATPPVELRIGLTDGKATCAPATLLLPADTDVELHIVSTADRPVVFTMPGQFENNRVLRQGGDLNHVESGKGYTIKPNGKGVVAVRSLPPGEVTYACTSTANMSESFEGKAVFKSPKS